MPWIEPEFRECVVYLYPSEGEAYDGARIGGSGFIVGVPTVGNYQLLLVVTNKHVTDRGNMTVRVNTVDGKFDVIPLDGAKWYFHPGGDDLAVCPIELRFPHKVRSISTGRFITKEWIDILDIGPGEDVFIVGRFVNHEGKQRNLPSVRFGNISQMPWEPILSDGFPQESFLVEARSISGYSGAPVFVYVTPQIQESNINPELIKLMREGKLSLPGVSPKRMGIPITIGPWLLGVDYCHIRWDEKIFSALTKKPINDDWFIKSNTGMMGVIPAWKLMEIIEGSEMKPLMDAAKKAAQDAQANSGAELDAAVADETSVEKNPNHREDFTSLLDAAARTKPQAD